MAEVSFPGDGQDGEQPSPGGPARDETAAGAPKDAADRPGDGPDDDHKEVAPTGPEDDWDPDGEMAAYLADVEAGRVRIPEDWEIEGGPAVTISLGDAADVDPAELAAMLGRTGWAGRSSPRTGPRM